MKCWVHVAVPNGRKGSKFLPPHESALSLPACLPAGMDGIITLFGCCTFGISFGQCSRCRHECVGRSVGRSEAHTHEIPRRANSAAGAAAAEASWIDRRMNE